MPLMEFLNMQMKLTIIPILIWFLSRICVSILLEDVDGFSNSCLRCIYSLGERAALGSGEEIPQSDGRADLSQALRHHERGERTTADRQSKH